MVEVFLSNALRGDMRQPMKSGCMNKLIERPRVNKQVANTLCIESIDLPKEKFRTVLYVVNSIYMT